MRSVPPLSRTSLLLAVAAVLVSCESTTEPNGPDAGPSLGLIGYPDNVLVTVPEAVGAGELFAVSVRTFGGDSCWEKARTEVELEAHRAVVSPYVVNTASSTSICFAEIMEFIHTVGLVFDEPGEAEVSFRGADGTVVRTVVVE